MKNITALLASVAALAIAAPAFASESHTESHKSSTTDAAGTTTKVEKDVKVKTNDAGETDATIKTEEVKDPKGLMNKSKSKTKEEVKTDANGTVVEHSKTVDGKVVVDEKK